MVISYVIIQMVVQITH